jgi:lipoate-protein ligase A
MNTENGTITDLQFFGDYFGVADSAELAELLKGTALERESLAARISGLQIGQYFHGLAAAEFLDLLLQSE